MAVEYVKEVIIMIHHIYEGLGLDTEKRAWVCWKCKKELGNGEENFKKFLLVREVPWEKIYPDKPGFRPDPNFCIMREYYCPECGLMIENENVPPGYPPIEEFKIDIDSLIEKDKIREPDEKSNE